MRPLARSGVYAGRDCAETITGIVNHQKTDNPATAAVARIRKICRSIHQSVISHFQIRGRLVQIWRRLGRHSQSGLSNRKFHWNPVLASGPWRLTLAKSVAAAPGVVRIGTSGPAWQSLEPDGAGIFLAI